jgi:aspartate racemase
MQMKIIGLIGGTSYESMATYYKMINVETNKLLGEPHSAKMVMVSLDFNEIVPAYHINKWENVEKILINAAQQLERAGADFIAICCNTLHKIAPAIKRVSKLPLLHIFEPVGQAIKQHKINKVGLLGTQCTMDDTFHSHYLKEHFQITSITPCEQEKQRINAIILAQLCYGIVTEKAKHEFLEIINSLKAEGAQGIILACTELYMLLSTSSDLEIPIFDTTELHAKAIVNYALAKTSTKSLAWVTHTQRN